MSQIPYTPAEFESESFNCVHVDCRAFAAQQWGRGGASFRAVGHTLIENLRICRCVHCSQDSIWWKGHLVWPDISTAPPANPDFPQEALGDYEEAASILSRSPRDAVALLRLVVQKLCKHLGEPGENINTDIGALVKRGLPIGVQQALDALRVMGNNAVHPGQMDLSDDEATAAALFGLVNFIVEKMISEPAEINRLYGMLPPGALSQIQRRDGTS